MAVTAGSGLVFALILGASNLGSTPITGLSAASSSSSLRTVLEPFPSHSQTFSIAASKSTVTWGSTSVSTEPIIEGEAQIGASLSVVTGSWNSGASFRYQWVRNGIPISGATQSSYELTTADFAKSISVRIVASNDGVPDSVKIVLVPHLVSEGAAVPSSNSWFASQLSGGRTANCVLRIDGTVGCWGLIYGMPGSGNENNPLTSKDVTLPVPALQVSVGGDRSCAVLSDGHVACWDRTMTASLVPGLSSVVQVSVGSDGHTCVLISDGTAKCWGYNYWGGLGDGSRTYQESPVDVRNLRGAVQVMAGSEFTCAVMADTTAKCWGYNANQELGAGPLSPYNMSASPLPVYSLSGVAFIDDTCAVLFDESLKCWGSNQNFRIDPDGWPASPLSEPKLLKGFDHVVAVTADGPLCALRADGTILCRDYYTSNLVVPLPMKAVALDGPCATLVDLTVRCWGSNMRGQLGIGTTDWDSHSTPVAPLGSTPVLIPPALPSISGTASVGSNLIAETSEWGSGVALSYTWKRSGQEISGAHESTYLVSAADIGSSLTVSVAATQTGFLGSTIASLPTNPVVPGNLVHVSTPSLVGDAVVGSTLSVDTGTWDAGVTISYQWRRSGNDIPGASGKTLSLSNPDAGHEISVVVNVTKDGYLPVSRESLSTALVSGGIFTLAPSPIISGAATVGNTLTAQTGAWDDSVGFSYQWRRGGVNITGATSSTYLPTNDDAGQPLTVAITGAKPGFTEVTRESPSTDPVQGGVLGNTPAPIITGSRLMGGQLSALVGTWEPGVKLSYQWLRAGAAIAGATQADYVVSRGDGGTSISLEVTGSKPGFIPVTVSAEQAAAIPSGTPFLDSSGAHQERIASGSLHTCTILGDATVKCWGANGSGQLGNGAPTTWPVSIPVLVSGLKDAIAVSANSDRTCAVTGAGSVYCWGQGPLGDGGSSGSSVPVLVSGIRNATNVSVGLNHACALLSDKTVRCWGSNSFGQLGNLSLTDSLNPVEVSQLTGVTQLASGLDHTCAVLEDGKVKCWGWNNAGQLGDGLGWSWAPKLVPGIPAMRSVAAVIESTCGLAVSGSVECWGGNYYGQLGDASLPRYLTSGPHEVSGIKNAVAISGGAGSVCAVLADTTIKCWGMNDSGQLGGWSVGRVDGPVSVWELSGALAVTAGTLQTCALMLDAKVRCWGGNWLGQLGDGTTNGASRPSLTVGIGPKLNVPAARVTGEYSSGSALVAETDPWPEGTILAFEWRRDGVSIAGATSNSYSLTQADAGHAVGVVVTGIAAGFSPGVAQTASHLVSGGTLLETPVPNYLGDPVVGGQLTALPGAWDDGVSFAYQWKRSGVEISGATESTYQLGQADAGHTITVVVTGSKPGYTSVSTESAATEMVTAGTLQSTPVSTVSGEPVPGSTLAVTDGTWDLGVTLAYAWLRDGVPIPGATSSTYVVPGSDVGHQIAVTVTGSKPGFIPATVTSAAVTVVAKTTASVNLAVPVLDAVDGVLSLKLQGDGRATFDAPTLVDNESVTVGLLPKIEIQDGRVVSRPGWEVSVTVDNFVNAADSQISFGGNYLGITPRLVSKAYSGFGQLPDNVASVTGGTVAGSAVYPATIASASKGYALDSVVFDGLLRLKSPQEKPAGRYNSRLSITVISK
jgi:alpha-tubulin suppressor-like RCC1 family protein